MKKVLIYFIVFIIISFLVYLLLPNKVSVLGYHGVDNYTVGNDMIVNEELFEKQMKFIKNMHFKTLTLEDMNCYMNNNCKISKNSVLITFDDGYLNNYEYAFPILKKYNLNAVVFVIGSYIDHDGFLSKDIIEKTKKEYPNIEFASHSYDLHYIEAKDLKYDDYVNDINKQKEIINTNYFAYPFGNYNNDYIKALKKNNYKLAFGFGSDGDFKKASYKDNKYVIPRLSISGSMPLWKYKLRLLMPY